MSFHVLISDNVDQTAIDLLKNEAGFEVTAPGKMSREETLAAIDSAAALIIRSATTADKELLDAATNLKAIARAGVGVDNVDLTEATRKGVVVMNTPDGNTIAAAEHTLALMLALARHIPAAHASMQAGHWDRKLYMGNELRGKTLGLVGFGRIGRAVAARAQAFQMTLIAHDPYLPDESIAAEHGVELLALADLYARSDYISLHAAVTDDTRNMINAGSIAQMKNGVRLVNVARGALVEASSLAEAIQNGYVAGAALDVYDPEPPAKDNPLIGLDGVVHTPHLGASTVDAQIAVAVDAARQIIDGLAQGKFRNVVNPDVLAAS